MNWKIFYSDGSTYSNDDGSPATAPPFDVQVIVQLDQTGGRYNQMGSDYYTWRDNRWWGVDIMGLFDYLAHYSPSVVKFGRTVDNETFQQMFRLAETDEDFPRRDGFNKVLEKKRPR